MIFRCASISFGWNFGLSSFDESVEIAETDLRPWYACCGTMADTMADTAPTRRTPAVHRNAHKLMNVAFELASATTSPASASIAPVSIMLALPLAAQVAIICVASCCTHITKFNKWKRFRTLYSSS